MWAPTLSGTDDHLAGVRWTCDTDPPNPGEFSHGSPETSPTGWLIG